MTRFRIPAVLLVALVVCATLTATAENWPGWRGPRHDGTSKESSVPVKWSATENVAWKTPLPGKGHASPVIWEDAVFIVAAIADTSERVLMRLDLATGKEVWKRTVLVSPMERLHPLNSHASSTPATDGEHVYVSFLDKDKMFIAAYDFYGNEVWSARPGVFSSVHGYCSSPILYKDLVIVNGDHDGPGYILALDRATGETRWKTPRPNNTRSYCPFYLQEIDGRQELVVAGTLCVASYDPDTGEQHWIINGPTEQYAASLVYNGEFLFLTTGFPDRHVLAIRPGGSGDVTDSAVAWRHEGPDWSYVPSPIAHGPYFLVVNDFGVASCLDAKTGEILWREEFKQRSHASLISTNGLVYFLSEKGTMRVIKPGPEYNEIARNELGEKSNASPALAPGKMLLRGEDHLFCIQDQ